MRTNIQPLTMTRKQEGINQIQSMISCKETKIKFKRDAEFETLEQENWDKDIGFTREVLRINSEMSLHLKDEKKLP